MKLKVVVTTLLAVLLLGTTGVAKEEVTREKPAQKDAAKGRSLVAAGAEVKKVAGDFQFTEGPAADAQGNVYFSDIPSNRILKWSLDGALTTFLEKSGGANGLYFDQKGNLLACQGEARRVVSISPEGEVTVLADKYNRHRLNSPNDLWVAPKGGVYFSDPRYGNRTGVEQSGEYVYYLPPHASSPFPVIRDMVRPNGLIGTADGQTLYVADAGAGKTYAYQINKGGTLSRKRLFAPEGSDGMTIDSKGNVYLTTKVVAVYNSRGRKIEEIEIPEQPANVTFAGEDKGTLFITARTSLYAVETRIKGIPTLLQAGDRNASTPQAATPSGRPVMQPGWKTSPSF